jgi:hypothetical protein
MVAREEQDRRNFVHTVEVLIASAVAERDLDAARTAHPSATPQRHTYLAWVLRLALPLGAAGCLAYYVLTQGITWGRLGTDEIAITSNGVSQGRAQEEKPRQARVAGTEGKEDARRIARIPSAGINELSDKSVMTLMHYASGNVPDKFVTPLGHTILVDRSKLFVPMETAREVIRVARLSAYAQLCELPGLAGDAPTGRRYRRALAQDILAPLPLGRPHGPRRLAAAAARLRQWRGRRHRAQFARGQGDRADGDDAASNRAGQRGDGFARNGQALSPVYDRVFSAAALACSAASWANSSTSSCVWLRARARQRADGAGGPARSISSWIFWAAIDLRRQR